MIIELLIMNGYGQFVWPAFIFSFLSCFYLYLRVTKELKKQEKIFSLSFKKSETRKIEFNKRKKYTEKALSIN